MKQVWSFFLKNEPHCQTLSRLSQRSNFHRNGSICICSISL